MQVKFAMPEGFYGQRLIRSEVRVDHCRLLNHIGRVLWRKLKALCGSSSSCGSCEDRGGVVSSPVRALPGGGASKPLFIAQTAAWVRLRTRIFRRIVLICTFTVDSAILILRAMVLFGSPSTK